MFAKAREKARQASCTSNLKQMGLAIAQYAQDYDETLPAWCLFEGSAAVPATPGGSLATWDVVIQPYQRNAQIITCPSDSSSSVVTLPDIGTTRRSYTYPRHLTVRALANIPRPADTVQLAERVNAPIGVSSWFNYSTCENLGDQIAWRHTEGANFLFVDGHVKFRTGGNGKYPDFGYPVVTANGSASTWTTDPVPQ